MPLISLVKSICVVLWCMIDYSLYFIFSGMNHVLKKWYINIHDITKISLNYILPEHLSSPLVCNGIRVIRSLVLCVCFVDRCLFFCPFSFGHCGLLFQKRVVRIIRYLRFYYHIKHINASLRHDYCCPENTHSSVLWCMIDYSLYFIFSGMNHVLKKLHYLLF
jgi:hypothetical protein